MAVMTSARPQLLTSLQDECMNYRPERMLRLGRRNEWVRSRRLMGGMTDLLVLREREARHDVPHHALHVAVPHHTRHTCQPRAVSRPIAAQAQGAGDHAALQLELIRIITLRQHEHPQRLPRSSLIP
jgi:hypothetical protein